ncbi:MAG: hypothetical protein NC924_09960 [Candidatus Omnitrophica bacterium]|nr:hypothetical protein [Candidatus Omnitrophota bacterium]
MGSTGRWVIAAAMVCALATGISYAQPQEELIVVNGAVSEIAADNSYIVVSGQKIFMDAEFADDAAFEVGDDVEIAAKKTPKGLEAVDFEYIFNDAEFEEKLPAAPAK